jgi:hypothetical protein
VIVESRGDGHPSVMGDVRGMWNWPSKGFRLEPGASVEVERAWGFTEDTSHTHVRYVFHLGWRGVGERASQRSTQWVDTMP